MSFTLGKFHFATYARRSVRLSQPTQEHQEIVKSSLAQLATLFQKTSFDWYVVGGLSVDLHLNKFTRVHHDIDIEIPSEQRALFDTTLSLINYKLFQKVMSSNIPKNKRLVLYKETDFTTCSPENSARHRMVRFENGSIVDGPLDLLSYIDVSFSRQEEKRSTVGYRGQLHTLENPYHREDIDVFELNNGLSVKLRNPVYHAALKKPFEKATDVHDKKLLESLITRG